MGNINLLGSPTRVETPFIKVTFGEKTSGYTFGVYSKKENKNIDINGIYRIVGIQYPNYIQSLQVTKINGQVNTYNLSIVYPITHENDPNFFDKVLSGVSGTRKITFSYGDLSAPQFVYRDEEAIITNVSQSVNIQSSSISYNITAISSGRLLGSGTRNFRERYEKPSKVILEMLKDKSMGLQDIFTGMRDIGLVEQYQLIPSGDIKVHLHAKPGMSILDYLTYLVSCMTDGNTSNGKSKSVYVFNVIDDISTKLNGPYFKIVRASKNIDSLDTYDVDIGYPDGNIVLSFNVQNSESYSIFYNYNREINPNEYTQRINNRGEIEEVYAPIITSNTSNFRTTQEDINWWTNVTDFPVKATMTIKGLLRPAILMSKVRVNLYFYGKKHNLSGLYIVEKQVDNIGTNGNTTTLSLIRVSNNN